MFTVDIKQQYNNKLSEFWFSVCVSVYPFDYQWGWSGGAKVLGKLPVPANLDYSGARAYCACSRCGLGLLGHFFSHLSLLVSFFLSLGDCLI